MRGACVRVERQYKRATTRNVCAVESRIKWFKLTLTQCVGDEVPEYVYIVYSPSMEHHRFDLGFKKMVSAIELTHYEVLTTGTTDDGDGGR